MHSEFRSIARHARALHLSVFFGCSVVFFPVIDYGICVVLGAHFVPSLRSPVYALLVLLGSSACAAVVANMIELLHARHVLRNTPEHQARIILEHVRAEYVHVAQCMWYRYALRVGCMFVLGATALIAYTHNVLHGIYVISLGLVACNVSLRSVGA